MARSFLVLAGATAILFVVPMALSLIRDDNTISSIYLGTVEGKSYFYDKTAFRNWTEAKQYCNQSDMQLASIRSTAQASFLKTKYNSSTFRDWFWLSGRDSLSLQQMAWDDDLTTPNSSILPFNINYKYVSINTCLYYLSSVPPSLYLTSCTSNIYTLCEVNHGLY